MSGKTNNPCYGVDQICDQICDVFKTAKRVVKTNQGIIGGQCVRNDDGVRNNDTYSQ